jgi:Ca2+-binding EF-hand superfamily protein
MKRVIENAYDFTFKKAFQAVDDWSYQYIDTSNLKRFLIKTSHVSTKQELTSILRRFDMDGDAKINFKEFQEGMKSNLTAFGKGGSHEKKRRPLSSAVVGRRKTANLTVTKK